MLKRSVIFISLLAFIALALSAEQALRAEFYKYIDKNGVLRFVDDPTKVPPEYRESVKAYEEKYDHLSERERLNLLEKEQEELREKQRQKAVEQRIPEKEKAAEQKSGEFTEDSQQTEDLETKVVIRGGHVLVPATLGYEHNEVQALLLLDTGATIIALHQKIADQLNITISRMAKAQVAGGKMVRFKLVNLSYIQIGPKRMENIKAGIIKYQGPPVEHNGLLGMNFLRHHPYSVDYKKQVIQWKP